MPVYGLGLLKDVTFRGGSISADARNVSAQSLRTMGTANLVAHLYPSLFALHDLQDDVAMANEATGWIPLPPALRPTYMSMESDGIYLAGELRAPR